MLLFKAHHIPLVMDGSKDESRRMGNEEKARWKVGSYHQVKKAIFTKEHFGYIKILEIFKQPLLEISEESARREGNYTKEEYIKLFHEIYPDAGDNPSPWVLRFKYVGMEKPVECPECGGKMIYTEEEMPGVVLRQDYCPSCGHTEKVN